MNPFTICSVAGKLSLRVFNAKNENTCAQLCTQYNPNNTYMYVLLNAHDNNVKTYQFNTRAVFGIKPAEQYVVTKGSVYSLLDLLLQDTLCPQLLHNTEACLFCLQQRTCFDRYHFSTPDDNFVSFCKKQPTFTHALSFITWERHQRLPLLYETKRYKTKPDNIYDIIKKYHCAKCFFFTHSRCHSQTIAHICSRPVHLHNIKKHLRNQYDHQTLRQLLIWADARLWHSRPTLLATGLTLFEEEPQCVFFRRHRRHFCLVKIPLSQLRGAIARAPADLWRTYKQLNRDALETKFALYVLTCSTQTNALNHLHNDLCFCVACPHEITAYTICTYRGERVLTEVALYQTMVEYNDAITQQRKEVT